MKTNINLRNKPELLAPAGNKETFYAVLRAGADAVYLAGEKFGARAYAENFSQSDICECVRYAHLYNRRVYLTVNTLVTDDELSEIYDFILPMYNYGLDGVIVQDLGVIQYIRKHFPSLEVHASTQLNTTGSNGALFLKEMGINRIVPARELSLNEVTDIKSQTGLEIECFVHGAMCYCYSGQCLFSSVIGGRSGNRGRCAQPCRLPYSINNTAYNNSYLLSLKDMCTIDYLPKLIDAGIDSFKIEGRMKKPEYAAGVTALYRKYIDEYIAKGSIKINDKDRRILESLYIRSEISNGYYERHNSADMVTLNSPSYNGANEATLEQIRKKYIGDDSLCDLPKIPIDMTSCFMTGDKASITVSYNDIYITKYGEIVQCAEKKPITEKDVVKQLNKLGSTVFITSEQTLLENTYVSEDAYYNLKGINELRREAIADMEAAIIEGYNLSYARADFVKEPDLLEESSDIEAASTVNTNKDNTNKDNINKDNINKDNINKDNINKVNTNIVNINKAVTINAFKDKNDALETEISEFSISISTMAQLKVILSYFANEDIVRGQSASIKRIYIPEELFITDNSSSINEKLLDILTDYSAKIDISFYIAMPYVRRMRDGKITSLIDSILSHNIIKGALVRNIEDLYRISQYNTNSSCCISNKKEIDIVADYGLYAWNREAISYLEKTVSSIGLPLELNKHAHKQLEALVQGRTEKMIYGKYPVMHTANCIYKTTHRCPAGRQENGNWISLTDRTKRNIPVLIDCVHCQNTLYNTVPLTLKNENISYNGSTIRRIDFTDEDSTLIFSVLNYYLGKKDDISWAFTNGFEKHSTE